MTLSFSAFETAVRAELVRTEAAVQSIVTEIVSDGEVALADLQGAGNWIASHAPQIAAGVTQAVALATALDAPVPAALLTEVQAASTALTVFAAAHNAGTSTASSVVSGYVAYKQATGALSSATAASIQAKANATVGVVSTVAGTVATAAAGTQTGVLAASVSNVFAPAQAAVSPAAAS